MTTRIVKLSAKEAFLIYGFKPRQVISWEIVLNHDGITLGSLLESGFQVPRLQLIQPSLAEWYNHKKATLKNVAVLTDWCINIPNEIQSFTLMDCIQLSQYTTLSRMLSLGLTFEILQKQYHMQPRNMGMFHYNIEDWFELGFDFLRDTRDIDDSLFMMLFNTTKRNGYSLYEKFMSQKNK